MDRYAAGFELFHARFACSESRETARRHLRGLLVSVERRNSRHIAKAVGDASQQPMQ